MLEGLENTIAKALETARHRLLAERTPLGHWEGELASSALSTATAVCALLTVLREQMKNPRCLLVENGMLLGLADGGLKWLASHANPDGGWGDTVRSFSNISTTTLCCAAFTMARNSSVDLTKPDMMAEGQGSWAGAKGEVLRRAESWLSNSAGGLEPERLATAIIRRYGKDRTFSVPILTTCAIAGLLGSGAQAWRQVIPLPFELAALPHRFYAALRLPVVSYALPALIAIGQARHHHAPSRNPVVRWLRNRCRLRTLAKLESIQPASGGYLEATPLTSFVAMSLASTGAHAHPVVRKAIEFLRRSVRSDGSWPIDTNLATWTTTLSINALCCGPEKALSKDDRQELARWLLGQQYRQTHPYTQAPPGGLGMD
jgi:squalene-hopene/tetraprenyl-beta-curcumene cyclase